MNRGPVHEHRPAHGPGADHGLPHPHAALLRRGARPTCKSWALLFQRTGRRLEGSPLGPIFQGVCVGLALPRFMIALRSLRVLCNYTFEDLNIQTYASVFWSQHTSRALQKASRPMQRSKQNFSHLQEHTLICFKAVSHPLKAVLRTLLPRQVHFCGTLKLVRARLTAIAQVDLDYLSPGA